MAGNLRSLLVVEKKNVRHVAACRGPVQGLFFKIDVNEVLVAAYVLGQNLRIIRPGRALP